MSGVSSREFFFSATTLPLSPRYLTNVCSYHCSRNLHGWISEFLNANIACAKTGEGLFRLHDFVARALALHHHELAADAHKRNGPLRELVERRNGPRRHRIELPLTMKVLSTSAHNLDIDKIQLRDRSLKEVHAALHRLDEGHVNILAGNRDDEPREAGTRTYIRERFDEARGPEGTHHEGAIDDVPLPNAIDFAGPNEALFRSAGTQNLRVLLGEYTTLTKKIASERVEVCGSRKHQSSG